MRTRRQSRRDYVNACCLDWKLLSSRWRSRKVLQYRCGVKALGIGLQQDARFHVVYTLSLDDVKSRQGLSSMSRDSRLELKIGQKPKDLRAHDSLDGEESASFGH